MDKSISTTKGSPDRRSIGDIGEAWAAWFLRRRGWAILARNWRNPRDEREELDLVARDGQALVFVEVKTRAAGAPIPGHAAFNIRKKRALRRAAAAYLRELPDRPRTTRFDLLVVEWGASATPGLLLYENVSLRTPRPFR